MEIIFNKPFLEYNPFLRDMKILEPFEEDDMYKICMMFHYDSPIKDLSQKEKEEELSYDLDLDEAFIRRFRGLTMSSIKCQVTEWKEEIDDTLSYLKSIKLENGNPDHLAIAKAKADVYSKVDLQMKRYLDIEEKVFDTKEETGRGGHTHTMAESFGKDE